jgi:hypothetical protein
MRIISGRRINDLESATILALQEAGKTDISADINRLFGSVLDTVKLRAEGEKSLGRDVHDRYGNKARYYGQKWIIPVPQLLYDSQPLPRIVFTIQGYLVAAMTVSTPDNSYFITAVGAVGKPERLSLPLIFIWAILERDLARFQVVGRDSVRTGWEVPGLKEALWLPNDFMKELSSVPKVKPVADWLEDFGTEGRGIAPWVVGVLLGLCYKDRTRAVPLEDQLWQKEIVLATLTQMFGSERAKEMLTQKALYLKTTMTNEDAVRFILAEGGNGQHGT